jgi:hypothetical protein
MALPHCGFLVKLRYAVKGGNMPRLPVPGPIVIPSCIEVKLHWSDTFGLFSNVLHGNLTAVGPINPALAETLFSALKANVATVTWLGDLATTISFTGVSVKDIRAANNPEFPSSSLAAPGTAVGPAVAINSALVVTLRSAQAGRAFRGRVYLAGLTATALASARQWTTGAGANAVAFVEGIQAVLTANSIPLVIAQRALQAGTDASGNPLPARLAAVVPVVSVDIANPRVDTQRKRLGR